MKERAVVNLRSPLPPAPPTNTVHTPAGAERFSLGPHMMLCVVAQMPMAARLVPGLVSHPAI